jgi:hypothetical protein
MFEKAARLKLRFYSNRGALTAEDLWDMSLIELNIMAKAFNKELRAQEEEDFLETENKEVTATKLKFDLVLHVLRTRQVENKAASEAKIRKETKQKILAIIEKKRDGALEEKTEEELLEELKKLD